MVSGQAAGELVVFLLLRHLDDMLDYTPILLAIHTQPIELDFYQEKREVTPQYKFPACLSCPKEIIQEFARSVDHPT